MVPNLDDLLSYGYLVLPLTTANTKLVLFLVLLSAGTLRASPALYTPGRVPMRSNDTLARLPRKKMMPVGKNPLSASLPPWPMGHQQRKRAQRATG